MRRRWKAALLLVMLTLTASVGLVFFYNDLFGQRVEPVDHTIPTYGTGKITSERFAELAKIDPIAAMEASLDRYKSDVRGYRCTLMKQERIRGTLHPEETIDIVFREDPFAVKMVWKKGSRNLAEGAIYPAGEKNGHMLVWISRIFPRTMDPRGDLARNSARFGIEEFGIALGTLRTRDAWANVRDKGQFQFEYLGERPVQELNDRKCHIIRRTCVIDEVDTFLRKDPKIEINDKTRADAHHTVTIYLDCENWLQTGSVLKRADGELIASYFFKDLDLNPTIQSEELKGFKK